MKNIVKVERKKYFDCDLEKLWEIVTDNSNYAWRSDLSKIEIVDDKHFIEYTRNNFPTHFTIISKDYLQEYRLSIKNRNLQGRWTGKFTKTGDGKVQADFVEEVVVGNLMMRILAKTYLKKQQKRYFGDLEKAISKL